MTATKKKPAKKSTKSAAKKAPRATSTAQSAPPIGVAESDLNPREARVLAHLRTTGAAETSREIGTNVFPGVRPRAKGRSWARNALRRLVREGFVVKTAGELTEGGIRRPGEGKYKAAKKAAKAAKKVAPKTVPAAAATETAETTDTAAE